MKSTTLQRLTGILVASLLAAAPQLAAQEEHERQEHERQEHRFPHYRVTDLGTLGGSASIAYSINSRGEVGGGATISDGSQHPFLWSARKGMVDLGTLGGTNGSAAGPNDQDELAVISETADRDPLQENFCSFGTGLTCLGAVWKHHRLTALPTLGGTNSQVFAINKRGQIVGTAETAISDAACPSPQVVDFEAAIWEPDGTIRELPALPGDTVGFALRLNNKGQAVGSSGTCADTTLGGLEVGPHAVLWDKGSPVSLGSLGGTQISAAAAINDQGDVVGGSDLSSELPGFPGVQVHSFLWTRERGMRDIGVVDGDFSGLPTQINNHRQVVGASCDATGNCRAFLWQNGVMKDLNALISADSPLHLVFALDINDSGEVVGQAVNISTGELHAFLAIPCDEARP